MRPYRVAKPVHPELPPIVARPSPGLRSAEPRSPIEGLENAVARFGLLEDALSLNLCRPQDYFQRL
jgi:hypothetical protein